MYCSKICFFYMFISLFLLFKFLLGKKRKEEMYRILRAELNIRLLYNWNKEHDSASCLDSECQMFVSCMMIISMLMAFPYFSWSLVFIHGVLVEFMYDIITMIHSLDWFYDLITWSFFIFIFQTRLDGVTSVIYRNWLDFCEDRYYDCHLRWLP